MSGRKVFTAGEVLQAADVNDYLMDQSVMVFGGTAARASAIPSPTDGMASYRTDDDAFEIYDGSAWSAVAGGKILQVVQGTLTTRTTISATSYTDTGLAVTITPTSATSKILVTANVAYGGGGTNSKFLMLTRGTTELYVPDTPGSRTPSAIAFDGNSPSAVEVRSASFSFLDSPATTSAVEYRIRGMVNATATLTINRSNADSDGAAYAAGVSIITAMEVSA